jgi:hypothetical protein
MAARKLREQKGRADPTGAIPDDIVVIDPERLGLLVGPDGLPLFVVHRSKEPPLGIRLTVDDARRVEEAFRRLMQQAKQTPEPRKK